MRLAVYGARGLGVRRVDEAEHLPAADVEPVLQITHAVTRLNLEIAAMRIRDRARGEAVNTLGNVHEERHCRRASPVLRGSPHGSRLGAHRHPTTESTRETDAASGDFLR